MSQQPESVVSLPAEQRAKLKELAEAATPGPWMVSPVHSPGHYNRVAELGHSPTWFYVVDKECESREEWPTDDRTGLDAEYIAAASPDVALATLRYIDHLEARVANYQRREKRGGETWLVTKQFITEQGEELNEAKRRLSELESQLQKTHSFTFDLTEEVGALQIQLAAAEARATGLQTELAAARAEAEEWKTGYRLQKEFVEPMQARIAEWEEAFSKQYKELLSAREQHKVEVLDILRDLRLPRLPLPPAEHEDGEDNSDWHFVAGKNVERQAINDYCRQKAYEYDPQGIGPDPTKPGQWDTRPTAPAPTLVGDETPAPPVIALREDRVSFQSPEYAARIKQVRADVESLESKNPSRKTRPH